MDFSNYSVKDFVLHESFQKWVLEPDKETGIFWENWLNAHPHKIDLITEARLTIQSVKDAQEENLSDECDQVWTMITERIQDFEREALLKKINTIENSR